MKRFIKILDDFFSFHPCFTFLFCIPIVFFSVLYTIVSSLVDDLRELKSIYTEDYYE